MLPKDLLVCLKSGDRTMEDLKTDEKALVEGAVIHSWEPSSLFNQSRWYTANQMLANSTNQIASLHNVYLGQSLADRDFQLALSTNRQSRR